MGSGGTRVKTGKLVGTGAAISVTTIGFKPKKVELYNTTSADKLVWLEEMGDGYGHKQVAAGTSSTITTKGVTPLANGFTIGTDTDINASGETIVYIAHE